MGIGKKTASWQLTRLGPTCLRASFGAAPLCGQVRAAQEEQTRSAKS